MSYGNETILKNEQNLDRILSIFLVFSIKIEVYSQ